MRIKVSVRVMERLLVKNCCSVVMGVTRTLSSTVFVVVTDWKSRGEAVRVTNTSTTSVSFLMVMVGVAESVMVTKIVLVEVLRSCSSVMDTIVLVWIVVVSVRVLAVVMVVRVVVKVKTVLVVVVVVALVRKLVVVPETVSEKEVTVTDACTCVITV